MLKSKLISFAVLSAVAGLAQAGGIPKDITFDGYCDGLHVVKNKETGGVTGTRTGCDSSPVAGGLSGKNVVVNDTDNRYSELVIVRTDGTWIYYSNLDGSVLNSGTWTAGAPSAMAKGTKSNAR